VDESQPTTSIQLRLGDGTRLVAKFNHTHTVGDIRRFVDAYPYEKYTTNIPHDTPVERARIRFACSRVKDENRIAYLYIFENFAFTRISHPATIVHATIRSLVIYFHKVHLTISSARRGAQSYNLMTTFPQKVICCDIQLHARNFRFLDLFISDFAFALFLISNVVFMQNY
jgi:hypothetical protein